MGVFLEWDKESPLRHCMGIISVTFYKLEGFFAKEWLDSEYKETLDATLQFGSYLGKKNCGNKS